MIPLTVLLIPSFLAIFYGLVTCFFRWFKTISAASQDFSEAAGTTVIVALTAEGLSSVIATPTGEQYDYVISANSLQTILDGETITRFDSLIELLLAFAVGCVIVLICR